MHTRAFASIHEQQGRPSTSFVCYEESLQASTVIRRGRFWNGKGYDFIPRYISTLAWIRQTMAAFKFRDGHSIGWAYDACILDRDIHDTG